MIEPNITCSKCRFRHPASMSCKDSKARADANAAIRHVELQAELRAADRRADQAAEDAFNIQSAHVIMVPWCQCCEARVPVDHVCSCEASCEVYGHD
jgi:hypothetical protein